MDLHNVFRALLYLSERDSRGVLPKKSTVKENPSEEGAKPAGAGALKKGVDEVRNSHGRGERTPVRMVDVRSVKMADTAQQRGYAAGKKVLGIKRPIAVDSKGCRL